MAGGRSLKYTIPFQSHHIDCKTFFGWRPILGVALAAAEGLPHAFLRLFHFSSLVIVLYKKKNGCFFSRRSNEEHIPIHRASLASVRSCGTQTLSLLTYPIWCRWRITLECADLKLSAVYWAIDWGFSSTSPFISSSLMSIGRPERGISWTEKFLDRNFVNHLWTIRTETTSFPNAERISSFVLEAFSPFWRKKKV